MDSKYTNVLEQIDRLHAQDPNKIVIEQKEVPYELHYSNKMTSYLEKRDPSASPVLRLAVRAQHLCRWEVPRDSYPMTRVGYFAWRTYLKKFQAERCITLCASCGLAEDEIQRIGHLIRKEDLKSDPETQVLEDVACLVFLDDQFADFEKQHEEDKIINIIKKTWGKMSNRGHDLALEVPMNERCKHLVTQAITA